jgi:hypothetical protein
MKAALQLAYLDLNYYIDCTNLHKYLPMYVQSPTKFRMAFVSWWRGLHSGIASACGVMGREIESRQGIGW